MAKRVFLDLDGVLADFIGGVLKLHNLPYSHIKDMKGSYGVAKYLNLSEKDFWGELNKHPDFWHSLSTTKEANDLVENIYSLVDSSSVYLLTSPSRNEHAYSGKYLWVKKHFPDLLPRLILTSHKHLLADRFHILVDDSDKNCNDFKKAGGNAILFPRPWNSKFSLATKGYELVIKEIRRFL